MQVNHQTQNVGFHLNSPSVLGPRKALLVTSRVSAHVGICTYLQGKVCMRIYEPSLHTPGYSYFIPVATTSDIV